MHAFRCITQFLILHNPGSPVQRMVPSTVERSSHPSEHIKTIPYRNAPRPVSWMILDPVKVTVKACHHMCFPTGLEFRTLLGRKKDPQQTPVGHHNLIESAAISFLIWWPLVVAASVLSTSNKEFLSSAHHSHGLCCLQLNSKALCFRHHLLLHFTWGHLVSKLK